MMTFKPLMTLAMLALATPATSATLLTMTGDVTQETYGGASSPYAEAATNVVISVLFDDAIAPAATDTIINIEVAVYISAILQTRVDVLGAGQTVLGSFFVPDPMMALWYSPLTGGSEMEFVANFAASPGQPFVELDMLFAGDNMFSSTELSQISAGRLDFATSLAQGDLETAFDTFTLDGIEFEFGAGAFDVKTINPVPSPSALLSMMTGLLGFGLLAWLKRIRCRKGHRAAKVFVSGMWGRVEGSL